MWGKNIHFLHFFLLFFSRPNMLLLVVIQYPILGYLEEKKTNNKTYHKQKIYLDF